jgi:NAD(P)-dependent dehydrogenase (short-subunit alcohol dehydrogenase family)
MSRFEGKVAFVTGATSGIGRAAAVAFAREGAGVAVTDVAIDGARETARLIEQAGGEAIAVRCDVTSSEQIAAALKATVERFGRLDIAFNNAGIEQPVAPAHEITDDDWDRLVAVNLRGAFVAMKHEVELMLRDGGGAIVNTSSNAGLRAVRLLSAYTASKHGILGLTKNGAVEYADDGIRVNAVCPGAIMTPLMEHESPERQQEILRPQAMSRFGAPEEVAAAVVWLCSEHASFVTGIAMPVDAGSVAGW